MKTVFYRKEGRKYIPVSEYDSEFTDSHRYGNYLVTSTPGSLSRRPIDPAFVLMHAATVYGEDTLADALRKNSAARPERKPLTQEQIDAWNALNAAFAGDAQALEWPAAYDAVRAVGNELVKQAAELLENPAVKNAYDEFMLICKLTKETK